MTRLVVLTGSGISADSGLSTFRGAGGLWEGEKVERVATPEAWERDPAMVWRFYQTRRANLLNVHPNAAHEALARLDCVLVTQNVDDLHERAGAEPIHMHGELAKLRCEACGHVVRDLEHLDPDTFRPCPACDHARMRPDIVWFGEMPYHMDVIERAMADCTHFVAIGTSGVVYPAAGFLAAARGMGAVTIVNSLDPPDNLHPSDRFVPGRAVDVIPELVEQLRGRS